MLGGEWRMHRAVFVCILRGVRKVLGHNVSSTVKGGSQ